MLGWISSVCGLARYRFMSIRKWAGDGLPAGIVRNSAIRASVFYDLSLSLLICGLVGSLAVFVERNLTYVRPCGSSCSGLARSRSRCYLFRWYSSIIAAQSKQSVRKRACFLK
jgi:hypothetical protein